MNKNSARNDRFERDLKTAFEALDEHDFDTARAALERCRRVDKTHADVAGMSAVMASIDGDPEQALTWWQIVIDQNPDDPQPRIAAASVVLEDLFDADHALELIDPALDHIDDEEMLVAAICTKAGAHLMLAEQAEQDDLTAVVVKQRELATEALSELASSLLDEPSDISQIAYLAVETNDQATATAWINKALANDDSRNDGLLAKARWAELHDDNAGMIAAWQEVRKADSEEPAENVPKHAEIESEIRQFLAVLPPDVARHIATAPLRLLTSPSAEMVASNIHPRLLVHFVGTPIEGDAASAPLNVPEMLIFTHNVMHSCEDADQFYDELKWAMSDEVDRYFNLDESKLGELADVAVSSTDDSVH
jgi:tetratricopeptide (TPR) repeat protein